LLSLCCRVVSHRPPLHSSFPHPLCLFALIDTIIGCSFLLNLRSCWPLLKPKHESVLLFLFFSDSLAGSARLERISLRRSQPRSGSSEPAGRPRAGGCLIVDDCSVCYLYLLKLFHSIGRTSQTTRRKTHSNSEGTQRIFYSARTLLCYGNLLSHSFFFFICCCPSPNDDDDDGDDDACVVEMMT
jgi:hypothetical protein